MNLNFNISFNRKISVKDRAFLARQLATMLTSGLMLDRALMVLVSQVKSKFIADSLRTILKDVESGVAFSQAMRKHPKLFDRVFINVVVSGEAVGKMAEVLMRLADQLEKENSFISKIKGALYYPIFVIITMCFIAGLMMVKVIPSLKDIFFEFDAQLPWMTRALISISDYMSSNWILVILFIIVAVVFLSYFFKTQKGKELIDYVALHYTLGLGESVYMARFSRTLSMLVESGTPIIEAIDITGDVMNNLIYQRILKRLANQVEKGVPISAQLAKSKEFPVLIPQMISIGEKTGELEKVLENLAVYYEEESDNKIKGLTSIFEPAIIVLIGLAVAFMVFSIIVPIYNIAQLG